MNKELNLWDQPDTKWLPFRSARNIARTYCLEYREEWDLLVKEELRDKRPLPENIPANPEKVYRHVGWQGWKDWLIHPDQLKIYTPFYEAREFVRSMRFKTKKQWQVYINQANPVHLKYKLCIPSKPGLEYKDKSWKNWTDWFGTNIEFKDFRTTRKFIRSLNFTTFNDWESYCNGRSQKLGQKAENIYAYPDIAYKNKGWESWSDWLGIDLLFSRRRETGNYLPEGAEGCRCKGLDPDCIVCDGKGYF